MPIHRRTLVLVAFVAAACHPDGPPNATTITMKEEIASLRDSTAGPAPASIARRLEADSAAGGTSAVSASADVEASPCASALRDPASGARYAMRRSQVSRDLGHPEANTTQYTLRGWADYAPLDTAGTGLAAGQQLRVDCASNVVAGIAPS